VDIDADGLTKEGDSGANGREGEAKEMTCEATQGGPV